MTEYTGHCSEHGAYSKPGDPAWLEYEAICASNKAAGAWPQQVKGNEVLPPDACPVCDGQAVNRA